jgi:hypothetical protein
MTPEREAMFSRRVEMIAAHPEAKTAGDLAKYMGEYEREYWIWTLERLEKDMNAASRPLPKAERSDPEGEQ